MSDVKVAFLPEWFNNPYQVRLREHLTRKGVQMVSLGRTPLHIVKGIIRERPDILHLHWLHAFYEARSGLLSAFKMGLSMPGLATAKRVGVRLVWTVHNLTHHENPRPLLDRSFTAFVIRRADAIIAHCATARRHVIEKFGLEDESKLHVIPHGHYVGSYANEIGRTEARKRLGIPGDDLVLLFFGQIRPYKGVLELVDAFTALNRRDVRLMIVGKPLTEESIMLLERRIDGHAQITFRPGFVPDDEVQVYMNACDAVVLPYHDILTSGAAVLAMSFGRACVAPRLGCINDWLDDKGAFLYESDRPGGLSRAMQAAIERRTDLPRMGAHNLRQASEWDWSDVAEETLAVYRRVCGLGE